MLLSLEWTGYIANALVQPRNTILGIQSLIGPIPAVFLVLGIFLAMRYPLDRKRFDQLRTDLAERRK